MFAANGCTVTLEDGTVLRRQRVVYEDDGTFRSYDRRTMTLRVELASVTGEATGKNRWEVTTENGVIKISKSGCGCGR